MTGMVGHSARVLEYWQARDAGTSPADAIRRLADAIKEDTHAWLQVSAKEYSQAAPINFGAERIKQISEASGIDVNARAHGIDATGASATRSCRWTPRTGGSAPYATAG